MTAMKQRKKNSGANRHVISIRASADAAHPELVTTMNPCDASASKGDPEDGTLPMTKLERSASVPPCLKPARTHPKKRASLDENDSAAAVYRKGTAISSRRRHRNGAIHRPSSVRFAPLPPGRVPRAVPKGKGNRADYSLGDAARASSHMIAHRYPEQAFQAVNSLKSHDFAFVKRLDGRYTYSILACRSLEPPADGGCSASPETLEECMVFVTCEAGSTVKLRKNEWTEHVRLVSTEGFDPLPPSEESKEKTRSGDSGGEWAPPNLISFVRDGNDTTSGPTSHSFH